MCDIFVSAKNAYPKKIVMYKNFHFKAKKKEKKKRFGMECFPQISFKQDMFSNVFSLGNRLNCIVDECEKYETF